MDFLDYIKICQEETAPLENNNRQNEESNGNRSVTQERRPPRPSGPGCRGQVYKVQKGDTLYSISRKYNLRVRDLMSANPFVNVYQLRIGEELCIPVVPDNGTVQGVQPYLVKRDDTVLSILNNNKLTFQELARLNRSAQVLKFPAGTVLLLPNNR
ncbi:MAG: LysM peptidoglycan-binding domain-containing protein [Lachnospiraceae bacterium]|nr:LysM peptidoglycan-binding domain-containing protein [Lachnospiraceae bacterium]